MRLRARVEAQGADFHIRIARGALEWGEEKAHFASSWRAPRLFEEGILPLLLRDGLWFGLERGTDPSRRMRLLIDELAKHDDPLKALKEERFLARVHLRLLSES